MTLRSDAAEIVFDHVTKRYGGSDRPAVDDLSLTIPAGEICVLIGPSGGGKTTAMKLVNRLITLTEGDITIDGVSILQMNPVELRRGIGYVIQQIGLFPHMTIEANVATVPKLVGWDKQRTHARARELLELVGLDPGEYAKRYPAQLSGGQRQRVGLARALAANPPLMLMDEPFGAIDPITRARLQDEFLRLQREVHKTVIFVTHDIDEAIKMGDRIAILRQGGKLAQYDTPDAILAQPADDFVADFVGADRGLKRLGLRRLGEVDLLDAPPSPNGDHRPAAGPDMTLRDALSLMLTEGSTELVVRDEDGGVRGYLTLEAVKMGDRIAILREGGVLAQYDTPDAILAHPADDFVAKFIGEDRALRRLALRRLSDVKLAPADGTEGLARVSIDTSVRNAVSLLLDTKSDRLLVENDNDEVVGVFRFSDAGALL